MDVRALGKLSNLACRQIIRGVPVSTEHSAKYYRCAPAHGCACRR